VLKKGRKSEQPRIKDNKKDQICMQTLTSGKQSVKEVDSTEEEKNPELD